MQWLIAPQALALTEKVEGERSRTEVFYDGNNKSIIQFNMLFLRQKELKKILVEFIFFNEKWLYVLNYAQSL